MSDYALALVETERGQMHATFLDGEQRSCVVQEADGPTDGYLRLGPKYGRKMLLTRDNAAALLPLLVTFVETGQLREIPALIEDTGPLEAFNSEYNADALHILVDYLSK